MPSTKGIDGVLIIAHFSVPLHIFLCNGTQENSTDMEERKRGWPVSGQEQHEAISYAVSRLPGETQAMVNLLDLGVSRIRGGSGPDLQHVHFGQQCIAMDA